MPSHFGIEQLVASHPCHQAGVRAQVAHQSAYLKAVDIVINLCGVDHIADRQIVKEDDSMFVAKIVELTILPGVSAPKP